MRNILTLLSAAALLSVPVSAQARGFNSDFSQSITGPIKLKVVASEDLAHRANNLPEGKFQRGSRGRLNAAFSNNGHYGDREITYLLEEMEEEIARHFSKRGITLSDNSPTILKVTIERVKPNRPTFNQLKVDSSLSFKSFSVGGADITANITSSSGEVLGQADYDYYSSFNDRPAQGLGTWSDARRAFSFFSMRLSKKLSSVGASSS